MTEQNPDNIAPSAAATTPRTLNYRKLLMEWSDCVAAWNAAPSPTGVLVHKDQIRIRRVDSGFLLTHNQHDRVGHALAHIYEGPMGKTVYRIFAGEDARLLRAYTPATGAMIRDHRVGGRVKQRPLWMSGRGEAWSASPTRPAFYNVWSNGDLSAEAKAMEQIELVFSEASDRSVEKQDHGIRRAAERWRRAFMVGRDEIRRLAETFPHVRMHFHNELNDVPTLSAAAINCMHWRHKSAISLHVPTREGEFTGIYLCIGSNSLSLPISRPLYFLQADYRVTVSAPNPCPMARFLRSKLKPAWQGCLEASHDIDPILEIVREWCAAGVPIPA